MKRLTLILLVLAFCATAFAGESQLQKATNVVNEIMGTPDKAIPDELLEKAVCVGIVPSQVKFALGLGGTYGRGVLVCRKGGNGAWDAPSMFTLGAELSAAAGPVGRSAEGATDAQLHAEILSYSRSQGLFAGASLDGAVVKQDRDDNEKLYGRKVTAKEILIDGAVPTPPAAQALDSTLTKYSSKGGQSFK